MATVTVITAALISVTAYAAFPDKPLTMVVPHKAGGNMDTMVRVLAKALVKMELVQFYYC